MNIFAYNISGQTIGTELSSWNSNDLSGNAPFAISASTMMSGYDNITSIANWDEFGESAGYRHYRVRGVIKDMYETNTGTTWSAYTINEQKILSKYFVVDKGKRDEVYTQEEQDGFNHYKIYDFLSDDIVERMGNINEKTTPKSIDYKKDVQQRFHPEYDFNLSGFLTGTTYYSELNVNQTNGITIFNFLNPIIRYEAQYYQNEDGYVTNRVVTRRWSLMDEEWSSDVKLSIKVYDTKTSREEGNRRRRNLINNLLIDTVGLIYITSSGLTSVSETESDAIPFLTEVDSGLQLYYESGSKRNTAGDQCLLIQQVSASTYNRLNNLIPSAGGLTIRDYLIGRLDP